MNGMELLERGHILSRLAELLRSRIAGEALADEAHVSASLGVAQYQGEELPEHFFARLDTLLYRAKAQGRNQVVVLSYGLWQRRFGGEPKVVGQKLTLDGEPMTVVGVMPPEFKLLLFDRDEELWWPQTPDATLAASAARTSFVISRDRW